MRRCVTPNPVTQAIPNDALGAFCRENHTALEPTGCGPLDSLSFAAKDVMAIAGHRTAFGQPTWYRTHEPARESARVIQQLLAAGARLAGVTLTDELSYSLSGENVHYGTPINPNAPGRIAGGSSSGSAAAVAGGYVDFALGTDCAGSVRLPASYCGIYGMRPSHGRVSGQGVIAFAPTFDALGWFARDAEVMQAVGRVLMDDFTVPAPPRRLLIAEDAFASVEPRIGDALQDAVRRIAGFFNDVSMVKVCDTDLREWMESFRVIQAAEIWRNLGPWVSANRPQFGPGVRERFASAANVLPAEVERQQYVRRRIVARIRDVVGAGDVLCLPSAPRIAPRLDTPIDNLEITYRYQAMSVLCIAGHGGLPQISLPMASLDGCPLGLSIAGQRGTDMQLLELAKAVCG